MLTTMTYAREPVPHDKTGQCPCCLKQHRASGRKNALQRHGWKETGRQIGQHGCGFQWGACHGSGMRPLEETDRSAVVVLARLATEIGKTGEALALHTKGEDTYRYSIKVQSYSDASTQEDAAKVEAKLGKAALTFTKVETTERRGRMGSTRALVQFTVTILRGAAKFGDEYGSGLSLPAWETLRARTAKEVASMLKALQEQETAIKVAVAFHFANPSNGGEDKNNRGPACHFKRTWIRSAESSRPGLTDLQRTRTAIACGAQEYRAFRNTAVEAEVTCARCLKSMAAGKKDEEKCAAQAVREAAREAKRLAGR